jgi:PPM family protein phosphatase
MAKNKRVSVSLTLQEYEGLKKYAHNLKLSMSSVVRENLRDLLLSFSTQNLSSQLSSQGRTDKGKVRDLNEDNFLLQSWPDKSGILAVIADGMGGHNAGEVASEIAINSFAKLLEKPLPKNPHDRYELLLERFYAADAAIRKHSSENFGTSNMGTTIVAAIVTEVDYVHLYAGDCRLYHFRDGIPLYITSDHSLVQVLVNMEQITPEEALTHPMRSVVNSCLGGKGNDHLFIDPKWDDLEYPVLRELLPGDILLLCSDGLHGELLPSELELLVQQFDNDPKELTSVCIETALERGGRDNITVIAIQIEENIIS